MKRAVLYAIAFMMTAALSTQQGSAASYEAHMQADDVMHQSNGDDLISLNGDYLLNFGYYDAAFPNPDLNYLQLWNLNDPEFPIWESLNDGFYSNEYSDHDDQWNPLSGGNTHALMQADGNFVLYASDYASAGWATGTNGNPGAWIAIANFGNLIVYNQAGTVALWTVF